MPQVRPQFETFARIKVVGVGGSGGNALTKMIEARIHGVEFIAINTDAQALHSSPAPSKVHIGKSLTHGLGAGMRPDIGKQAAVDTKEEIQNALRGADMVFVAYGLGGGTGTGAGPIVAEISRELGALTVGVVTKPFSFEGMARMRIAEEGLNQLKDKVDALITIPNDRLLSVINRNTPMTESFAIVDDVLRQGVQGISDLITIPGRINVDFADVKTVMSNSGSALMGIGTASGDDRALLAAKAAIESPLLEVSIDGAKGVLFNVTGGPDLAMVEVSEAARVITEHIDRDANVIFGAVIDESMKKGEIKITVVATGFPNGIMPSRQTMATSTMAGIFDGMAARPVVSEPRVQEHQDKKEIVDPSAEQELDIDIPAFIRRKMK